MGLDEDLMDYERETHRQLFEVPQTVSWERIIMKIPRILSDIDDAVTKERKIYI